jgi:hypothetical protein
MQEYYRSSSGAKTIGLKPHKVEGKRIYCGQTDNEVGTKVQITVEFLQNQRKESYLLTFFIIMTFQVLSSAH